MFNCAPQEEAHAMAAKSMNTSSPYTLQLWKTPVSLHLAPAFQLRISQILLWLSLLTGHYEWWQFPTHE